jgi:uncharacterized protein YdeI (YjbR/CyaY-like superfamily)
MSKQEVEEFYPETKQHLRKWLQKNHLTKDAVWLIFYKKHTGKPSVAWTDAVDEALCFGWIDSKGETIDKDIFRQYFCKRKPTSTWSKINKQKIESLTAKGLMTEAGFKVIDIAKQNGSWTILDDAEELVVPPELQKALEEFENSKDYFSSLSKSKKKVLLYWIALAKTETTRQNRILEIAENASQKQQPEQFRPKRNGI